MELPQKVYYINLENKQENNKLFLERIHKLNLFSEENIIRFEGIDGRKEGKIDRALKIINKKFRMNKEKTNYPGKGQQGVYLSHYLLLKHIYDNTTDECVMICEDDCGYSNNFEEYLKQTIEYIQNNKLEVDFLQVGNQERYDTPNKFVLLNENLKLVEAISFCLHCYIITREGIKNLLNYFDGLEGLFVIDIDILKWKTGKQYLVIERKTEEQISKLIEITYFVRCSGITYQMLVDNSMHNFIMTEKKRKEGQERRIKGYNENIKKQLENW